MAAHTKNPTTLSNRVGNTLRTLLNLVVLVAIVLWLIVGFTNADLAHATKTPIGITKALIAGQLSTLGFNTTADTLIDDVIEGATSLFAKVFVSFMQHTQLEYQQQKNTTR